MKRSDIISDDKWMFASIAVRNNVDLFLPKLVKFQAFASSHYEANLEDGGFIITSGFRTIEDHVKVYKDLNAKRAKQKLPPLPTPMFSKHLFGLAVDIYDPKKRLQYWCLMNERLLKQLGLYFERFETTVDWVHAQGAPPHSGKTFYWPY